jgi:hypothetical protein
MELKKRRFLPALEQCGLNNEAALSHASKPCNNGAKRECEEFVAEWRKRVIITEMMKTLALTYRMKQSD